MCEFVCGEKKREGGKEEEEIEGGREKGELRGKERRGEEEHGWVGG